ncbi:uncharacterized protein EDB93DRAFT_1248424 [Suillus bovinus]|uniref:uncharacterized protein n=1 Tax=Suillus bovinus TaxID=48563 RepID=UPI001B87273D|nr:uncharacterized protein EDB93DRAFT_1248424 [Suillus bovinus]KAG2154220.1 hypothetical protein EDB93DRAFT_1248424 [Suillus bovinus]
MAPHMGTHAAQPGTSSGLGQKAKQTKLLAKMASLLTGPVTRKPEETPLVLPETEMDPVVLKKGVNEAWEDVPKPDDNCFPQSPSQSTPSCHTQPDLTSARLCDSWKALIPTLVEIQLDYTA